MVFVPNGIEFEDAEFYDGGSLRDGTLLHDAVVGGLACAGGFDVDFYESGKVRMARLASDTLVAGVPCKSDHYTFFHENGTPWNTTLASGYESEGRQYLPKTRVTLDDRGRVLEWRSHLPEDEVIQGIPCLGSVPVWFYTGGRLSMAYLSQPWLIEGTEYPAWTQVTFEHDGKLTEVNIFNNHPRNFKERVYGAMEV